MNDSSSASQVRVTAAVLPAAGLGTRFLPATKAIPKEMLPLVDKPALQYTIEECVRAGLDDIVLVTGEGKEAMEAHFEARPGLEERLASSGKHELLAKVTDASSMGTITSVLQAEALGLGHAVLMAAEHVGERSFAVLLGDDLIDPADHFLERMIELHELHGRAVVAVMEVPEDQTHRYGVVESTPTDDPDVFEVTALVEKPEPGTAPSNLIIIGRYVLPGRIFSILRDLPPGRGGEIQLTDALQILAAQEPIIAIRFDGVRHDSGELFGWLQANVRLAAEREDVGPELLAWLREWVPAQGSASDAKNGADRD
ncbi:MAG: UTP--glucose-1-phosphate uridylyltransferase [Glaciecola sp.]